jgi:hypothetical protein
MKPPIHQDIVTGADQASRAQITKFLRYRLKRDRGSKIRRRKCKGCPRAIWRKLDDGRVRFIKSEQRRK